MLFFDLIMHQNAFSSRAAPEPAEREGMEWKGRERKEKGGKGTVSLMPHCNVLCALVFCMEDE